MSNDRSYLSSLQDYYARHRAFPSYSSIGALLGLRSKSSVAALVARLKLGGYIESTPDRRIAPTRRFFERPLAEAPVQAGLPNPIDDAPADALTIDDYLIEQPFADRAGAGQGRLDDRRRDFRRRSGRRRKAQHRARGEIVIAIVDNQFTLKRLDLERGRFILRPENKAYPVIRPEGTLEIFGVMVGLVRKCLKSADRASRRLAELLPGHRARRAGSSRLRPAHRRTSPRVPCRSAPGRSPCSHWCRRARACATRSTARPRHPAASIADARGQHERTAIVEDAHLVAAADSAWRRIVGM